MFITPEITSLSARSELTTSMEGFISRVDGTSNSLEKIALRGELFALRTPWGTPIPTELSQFAQERLPGRNNPIKRVQLLFKQHNLG